MQGTDRPIPIRRGRLSDSEWPEGQDRDHLQRLVRHFTLKRVRLDAGSGFTIGTLNKGNPDQKRRDKKANFMALLQAELLHHEHWDGSPRN